MKEPEARSPLSQSRQVPQHSKGTLDETRELFDRMAGEATRWSALEREKSRSRNPVARVLLVSTITACLLAVATGLYGVYKFPDAPIRQTSSGYSGKGGKPHTREDFEAFIYWEKAMLIVFPSAFLLGFAFGATDAKRRRKPIL